MTQSPDTKGLSVFEKYLTRPEFELFLTSNSKELLQIARERSPDIILMDVGMAELAGRKMPELLKKDGNTGHIPG